MLQATVSKVLSTLRNLPGWKTNRKLVVFESDDWGSVRMPSKEAFERLQTKGVDVTSGDSLRYNRYDTLANEDDFCSLFEALNRYRDIKGNHPAFTAVSMVANPDFEKIKFTDFAEYHYEPFTETLKRYYPNQNIFNLWQEGKAAKLFIPQFHGREHVNVKVWLAALQQGDPATLAAFEEGCWGFTNRHPLGIYYQAAFELELPKDIDTHHEILSTGLQLFEKIHGERAVFFVPPNGPINNQLGATAYANGIQYVSTAKLQLESLGHGKTKRYFHYLGQRSRHGVLYMTRNCFFEPSQQGRDWIGSCLKDIEQAFYFRTPAVISSHRVNYIGALDERNRVGGIKALDALLKEILKRWPEVEFLSTGQLGRIMEGN